MTERPFTIRESRTTPSRRGKAPRPVWIVEGATAGYELALEAAGGKRYQGKWSFWSDPTADLADAERATGAGE